MTPGNNPHLDPIALGVKPAQTVTEKYIRHLAESGDILRRCMNHAKEEAMSLRKQLDAAQADLADLQEKYAQSESDRLDAEAKLERLHQIIERQHPAPESN